MTARKKVSKPVYDNYEPGEPAEEAAKAEAARLKKEKHDHLVWRIKDTLKWLTRILLAVLVLGGVTFGLNRWAHLLNEDKRKAQAFYSQCISSGNSQYRYQGSTICFSGTVTNTDTTQNNGDKKCLAAGDYPVKADNGNSYFYLCVHGRIVAVL